MCQIWISPEKIKTNKLFQNNNHEIVLLKNYKYYIVFKI